MSATFDATTTGEYSAATTAAARSAVIVAALTGTISVKVFNGSNTEMGSGTMAAPWATSSGDTVLIGEVSSFTVGTTGTPDADWYIRFQNAGATRWVRGSFGLAGSGQDFTWSLDTWTATHTGTIGTATIITTGNAPPAFTVAPTSRTLPSSGGTIQFTAVDPEGVAVTYSMSARTGFSISPTTGLVTVTSAAAGSTGNITVTASDGVLSVSTVCAVTVAAVTGATFTIPAATANYNAAAVSPGDTIVIEGDASGNRGPLKITNANGTSTARITVRNPTTKQVNIGATGTDTFILDFDTCSYLNVDGSYYSGATYGIHVTVPSSTSSANSLIKYTNYCHHITIRWFSVDAKRTTWTTTGLPIGVQGHHNAYTRAAHPGEWFEGHVFEHFDVRNCAGEGLYIGPNFSTGSLPMRNITVRYGNIQNCGRDGIQVKCWWEGTNVIHDLTISNVGLHTADPESGQLFGISVLSGMADVYNNVVTDTGESGIQCYVQNGPVSTASYSGYTTPAQFTCRVYNNVVTRTGEMDAANSNTGHGVTVGADSTANVVKVRPYIYSNTIVNNNHDSGAYGVITNSNTLAGFVKNNIILGNSNTISASGHTVSDNLTTGTVAGTFVNPGADDYRLLAEQVAVGTIGTDYSSTDIVGASRSGVASKGAYEYA